MTTLEETRNTRSLPARTTRAWLPVVGGGAAAASIANLLILAVARAADASLAYVDDGVASEVGVADVVLSSTLSLVLGTTLAVLLALRWAWMIRVAQVVGAGLALVTIAGPLAMDTDGGTQFALAAMHVVVGVAVVALLEAGSRRAGRRW